MITPEQVLFRAAGRALSRFGTSSMRRHIPQRGGEDVIETLTRADTGRYVDYNGTVQTAENNALRIEMVDLDGDGVRDIPAFSLEGARTNVCLEAERLDQNPWANIETPIVTANDAIAPNGATTADKIEDDNGGGAEGRLQQITIANDSTSWCAGTFVKKVSGTPAVALRMEFLNGGGGSKNLIVDPSDGDKVSDAAAGAFGVELIGDYYFIWLVMTNDTSGNTLLRVRVYPAARASGDVAAATIETAHQGSNHFWGTDVQNAAAPSSYIPTVASSVARATDNLSYPFHAGPQAVTVYSRHRERGNVLLNQDTGLWSIGDASSTARLRLYSSGINGYRLYQQAAGTALTAVPSWNDTVEEVAQIASTGSGLLIQSLNGAATTQQADTFSALPTAWNAAIIYLNSLAATAEGYVQLVDFAVFAGNTHSMADCRTALQQ